MRSMINLKPQTSNLKSQISNLKSQTLNLKSQTSNLKSKTSNLHHVLHIHGIALEDIGEGLRTDGDGTLHKLGDVVATQELAVIVGILAR